MYAGGSGRDGSLVRDLHSGASAMYNGEKKRERERARATS